jgi:hypothetical protein
MEGDRGSIVANTYFNSQFIYNKHTMPVLLDCNFVVDVTNGNGLGIRNLKGPGIANVFMHTTNTFTGTETTGNATITGIASGTSNYAVGGGVTGTGIPANSTIVAIPSTSSLTLSAVVTGTGAQSLTYLAPGNPNPAAGIIVVQLGSNYFRYYGGFYGFNSPLSGTNISISGAGVLTVGSTYVITSLGTTTQAQWVAAGLNAGETAAVGIAFTAKITGGGSGTGTVQAPSVSGLTSIESVGDPNATFANTTIGLISSVSNTKVMQPFLYFQTLGATSAGSTVLVPTQAAQGTTIGLSFYLSNSSVVVKGE